MFNKPKSKEFLAYMNRDRTGSKNPMYGKAQSEETLAKFRKKIYIYDSNKLLVECYDGVNLAIKGLKMSSETIMKYRDTGNLFKRRNIYIYSKPL
jgi:group I intron endonuclease